MRKITIEEVGGNFAVGLIWEPIKNRSEIQSRKVMAGLGFGLLRGGKNRMQIGLASEDLLGLPSLAAVLCISAKQPLILIHQLGEEEFWLFACADGQILPGGDKLFAAFEDAVHAALEFVALADDFLVCSRLDPTEIADFANYQALGIFDLVDRKLLTSPKPDLAVGSLSGKSNLPPVLLFLVLGMGIVGAGYYWSHKDEQPVVELTPERIEQIRQDLNSRAQQQITDALSNKVGISAMLSSIFSHPFELAGWTAQVVSCNKDLVSYEFSRATGSVLDIERALGDDASLSLDAETMSVAKIEYPPHSLGSENSMPGDLQGFVDAQHYVISIAQRSELGWTIQGVTDLITPAEVPAGVIYTSPFKKISFSVSGNTLPELLSLADRLSTLSGVQIKSLDSAISKGLLNGWAINADIFATSER